MYTTLNKIREHKPCTDGWETLLKYLGKTKPDDEPLPLLTILDSNGFYDTLWCFRAVDGFEKEKKLLAITYAREVEHLMPAKSKKSLDVFEQYTNGLATEEEFEAARRAAVNAADAAFDASAACAAARAARAAYAAARAAARAAYAAYVARAAARAAARSAAAAARAVYAAYVARADAYAYAYAYAAWSAADADAAYAADSAADAYAYAACAAARATVVAYAATSADARAAWLGARSTIKAKQETQLRELLEKTK